MVCCRRDSQQYCRPGNACLLVFELRQNTDAVRANTYQEMNAVISQVNGIFLENPEVSEFIGRTASGE